MVRTRWRRWVTGGRRQSVVAHVHIWNLRSCCYRLSFLFLFLFCFVCVFVFAVLYLWIQLLQKHNANMQIISQQLFSTLTKCNTNMCLKCIQQVKFRVFSVALQKKRVRCIQWSGEYRAAQVGDSWEAGGSGKSSGCNSSLFIFLWIYALFWKLFDFNLRI